jgi:hypothetical protein
VRALLRRWRADLDLHYTILPDGSPRRWPVAGARVGHTHINGGLTYRDGSEVFIFRKEEFPKVMLHEALHHTRAHAETGAGVAAWLRRTYRVASQTPLRVEEGIVEAVATLAQAAAVADEGLHAGDVEERERQWAFAQARRLLAYQKKYFAEWQEDTNAFAYLVVRALCLTDVARFRRAVRLLRDGRPVDWAAFFQAAHATAAASWQRSPTRPIASMRMTVFGDC